MSIRLSNKEVSGDFDRGLIAEWRGQKSNVCGLRKEWEGNKWKALSIDNLKKFDNEGKKWDTATATEASGIQ